MIFWRVLPEENGLTLISYLRKKEGLEMSQREFRWAVEHGCLELNHRIEKFTSTRVATGDVVSFKPLKQQDTAFYSPERIIYRDQTLLAYDKPSGVSFDVLCKGLSNQLKIDILPVHRLDKETSGAILFALNEQCRSRLEDSFRKRLIEKSYLTIVDGIIKEKEGKIVNYLSKVGEFHGQSIWGEVSRAKGQIAETHWSCLVRGENASLIRCQPKTGRTHQIRVHLCGLGHPILGDFQYGKKWKSSYRPTRQLLHAEQINFVHPDSHQQLTIKAPIPEDMQEAIQILKLI